MDRRNFLKLGSTSLAIGAIGASNPASAFLNCSAINGNQAQQCEAGISSTLAHISAASVGGQHNTQWCWAACIEMVFKYYGFHVPQEAIVQQTWGQIVNLPGQPNHILANLNRPWIDSNNNRFRVTGDSYSANPITAAQDLANNMPLIIGTMGHAMVLTSLQYTRSRWGNGNVTAAIVRDPWPGRGRRVLTAPEWYNTSFLARIRVNQA